MAQTPGVEVSVRRSSLAGGPPFHTTQTKAVEFPGAALSPACRRQAAGEGAGLDATSPQSFRETPTSARDPACTRSSPAPPPQFIAHHSSATVAHPRLPTPGSRECGTRNFNFTANPKTNQLLRQLPQWYHPPSPCVSRNHAKHREWCRAKGWATRRSDRKDSG